MDNNFNRNRISLLKSGPAKWGGRPVLKMPATPKFSPVQRQPIPKNPTHIIKLVAATLALVFLVIAKNKIYAWNFGKTQAAARNEAVLTDSVNTRETLNTSAPAVIGTTSAAAVPVLSAPAVNRAAAAAPAANKLTITATPTGYLNIRDMPSTGGNIIAQAHPGETYAYADQQNGWYKVALSGGQTGWVDGQYVAINGVTPSQPIIRARGDSDSAADAHGDSE